VNYTSHRRCCWVLSLGIASLSVVQPAIAARQSAGLVIQVLEANAGQNLVEQDLPPIKVRVLDRTGRAIPGANVTFAVPEEGSFGLFLPNASQVSVTTDTQGIAIAPRFRTNSNLGDYQTQILASYRDSASRIAIPQSNVLKKKSSNKKLLILSAVIGGAAAAALASRGGGSGPAASALETLASPTLTLGQSSASVSPSGTPSAGTTGVATTSPGSTSSSGTATSPTPVQPMPSTPIQGPPLSSKCKGKKDDCR
jgi:hypothetical protein